MSVKHSNINGNQRANVRVRRGSMACFDTTFTNSLYHREDRYFINYPLV